MVYVINKHNKPLMPTKQHDRVRILFKQGLAIPVCNNPFTTKLKYDGKIEHGSKNKKKEYCKTISSGCTPYIKATPI